MSNPNNSFGTNAGYSGRTSVNAFNDVLSAFNGRGILSGWECAPDSGMSVVVGGSGTSRDVAIAEDNSGNKTTINNISESPISITIASAPATNSRIDAIVVYVNNPPVSQATIQDNYDTIGVLDVQGTEASSPIAPNDSAIRTAITADGASGVNAYYVVLAYVTVASGTTDITSNMITAGPSASVNLQDGSVTATKLASLSDITSTQSNNVLSKQTYSTSQEIPSGTWIDGSTIYKLTVNTGAMPDNTSKIVQTGITNFGTLVKMEGTAYNSNDTWVQIPRATGYYVNIWVNKTNGEINILTNSSAAADLTDSWLTLYYTKTS